MVKKYGALISAQTAHQWQEFCQKRVRDNCGDGVLPTTAGVVKQVAYLGLKRAGQTLKR